MQRFLVLLTVAAARSFCQMPDTPLRSVNDPGAVTTSQRISPAGIQSIFSGRVQGVVFGSTSSNIWVLNSWSIFHMDWRENRVLARAGINGVAGMQGVRYDSASQNSYFSTVIGGRVELSRMDNQGKASVILSNIGRGVAGAVAYSAKGHIAVVPLTGDSKVAVIDTVTEQIIYKIETGMVPFGAAVNEAGTIAYVTNWGGRKPTAKDLAARTGYSPDADRIVVDSRGIASTGTVARVDLVTGRVEREIPTGLHPTSILWDEGHGRVYVANSNQDSVSVIDTATDKLVRAIAIQPFRERVGGIAPTALAISPDGNTLYAACGGINAIAVLQTGTGKVNGLIPTAWYPSGLAMSPDAKYLAVSTLLGAGSGFRDGNKLHRFVHAVRGSVSVIEIPTASQLASYTLAVAENNHLPIGPATELPRVAKATTPLAIPARTGDPSLIDHVVFVIKENRTYDQVLGDMKKGNGDPSLVMFGKDITPNQHKFADQYVLLDNFYATGGNSADGHQWLTQANETDYVLWPGYTDRSYPFDGTDPIAYSSHGFLWDAALRLNKTVRIFGEFAGTEQRPEPLNRAALLQAWKDGKEFTSHWSTIAPISPLNKIVAANYPGYSTEIPDVIRAQIFLADLKKWIQAGSMPNLTMIALPSNHTNGASPGASTPQAMVADNDLAIGQIVEALSNSPFWKSMAIFIVEDDAQDGVDHVDGHRTAAFVVSPYVRRGTVDSTFYSHPSILKTIELALGLPTLTIFDRIATEMRACFQNTPDFTPYSVETPKQSLYDRNPAKSALRGQARSDAIASSKMRWDVPDAAPSDRLNAILWRQVRGYSTPYPKRIDSVFSPYSVDVEDEDRDEKPRRPKKRP